MSAQSIECNLFKNSELVRVNTLDPTHPKGAISYVERLGDEWFYTVRFDDFQLAKNIALGCISSIPSKNKRLRAVSILASVKAASAIIPERYLYQDEEDIEVDEDV
mgnify:CR=1 FL=1